MEKIVIASNRKNSGKTSTIIGLGKFLEKSSKKIGYVKPLGDRAFYRKKRLWDTDTVLIANIFDLHEDEPEDMTIGFDHSRLRFMYNQDSIKEKLEEIVGNVSKDKDIVFIESGWSLSHGISIYLDPITVTKNLHAKLLLVLDAETNDTILDDIIFIKSSVNLDIELMGVIINKVRDIPDFEENYVPEINKLGIKIIGIIPYKPELNYVSMAFIHEKLFGKILAGNEGLSKIVKNIFIGAMSAGRALRDPSFDSENKLIITSGDRSDMVHAALESNTSGIILTNNIIPDDPKIVSKATANNIPLILVREDTFKAAKTIDDMEILFTPQETDKIEMLAKLFEERIHIDL